MNIPAIFLAMLLVGWVLSLGRKGFWARACVIGSVPVGAFLGAYGGGFICWLVFRLNGQRESQHEWIAWVDWGLLGMIIGLIALPAIALAFTERKKNGKPGADKNIINDG